MIRTTTQDTPPIEQSTRQIIDCQQTLVFVDDACKDILANLALAMQVYVILPKRISLFVFVGCIFAQSPKLVGKVAVRQLVIQDKALTGEVRGTVDGGNKLSAERIQSQRLRIRGAGQGIQSVKAKGKRPRNAERPVGFDGPGQQG